MGRKICLTSGKFSIVHPGHCELFEFCKKLSGENGSVVVGVNSDTYILQQYGKVLIPLVDRVYHIKSIRYVDYVTMFSEQTACELIRKVRPHFFVKGADYFDKRIPEQDVCEELGIKYIVAPQIKKYNSSQLLNFN